MNMPFFKKKKKDGGLLGLETGNLWTRSCLPLSGSTFSLLKCLQEVSVD